MLFTRGPLASQCSRSLGAVFTPPCTVTEGVESERTRDLNGGALQSGAQLVGQARAELVEALYRHVWTTLVHHINAALILHPGAPKASDEASSQSPMHWTREVTRTFTVRPLPVGLWVTRDEKLFEAEVNAQNQVCFEWLSDRLQEIKTSLNSQADEMFDKALARPPVDDSGGGAEAKSLEEKLSVLIKCFLSQFHYAHKDVELAATRLIEGRWEDEGAAKPIDAQVILDADGEMLAKLDVPSLHRGQFIIATGELGAGSDDGKHSNEQPDEADDEVRPGTAPDRAARTLLGTINKIEGTSRIKSKATCIKEARKSRSQLVQGRSLEPKVGWLSKHKHMGAQWLTTGAVTTETASAGASFSSWLSGSSRSGSGVEVRWDSVATGTETLIAATNSRISELAAAENESKENLRKAHTEVLKFCHLLFAKDLQQRTSEAARVVGDWVVKTASENVKPEVEKATQALVDLLPEIYKLGHARELPLPAMNW